MVSLIGIIGSICFAICGIPQAYLSYKTKKADGISWAFLILWLTGIVFSGIFAVSIQAWPLIINYVFSGACALVISYYKWKE